MIFYAKSSSRQLQSLWLALLLAFLLIMLAPVAVILVHKHLAADGSHILSLILDKGEITQINWARQFANDITQWPVVLAVHLGLRDISLLSHIFGLGLIYLYPLGFLVCLLAVRGERPVLLMFPLISIAGVNLPASGILSGESHEMVLLAWPILFLAIRRAQLTALEVSILWFLLLLFTRVHETSLPTSVLFAGIFFVRLQRTETQPSALRRRSRLVWSVALALSAIGILIAIHFILHPVSPANKSSFAKGIPNMIRNPRALLATAITAFLSLGLLTRRLHYYSLALLAVALFSVAMIMGRDHSSLGDSFQARGLGLVLLPLLLLSALLVSRFDVHVPQLLPLVLIVYLSVATCYEIASLSRWNAYLNDFRYELTRHEGLIPLADTQLARGYGSWGWTNPTLSVLLQAPCVRSIVLNDPTVEWQPFDPSHRLVLQDFVAYGPVLHPIDPRASRCD